MSTYAYVSANPLTGVDSLGLRCGCKKPGDSSRQNNPNFNKNILAGAGAGAIIGIVALNVVGFPEAEVVEGAGAITLASVGGIDGATALAGMDALAGEPLATRFVLSLAGAANGGAVGGLIGFTVTPPKSAACP